MDHSGRQSPKVHSHGLLGGRIVIEYLAASDVLVLVGRSSQIVSPVYRSRI